MADENCFDDDDEEAAVGKRASVGTIQATAAAETPLMRWPIREVYGH